MFDVFGVPWPEVQLDHVRQFLAGAGDDEGLTWEAKADDDEERQSHGLEEPGRLRPQTIRKGACAFANQIGGYLILGARWHKKERQWFLPGIVVPELEAKIWLANVLESLRPTPRFDARTWALDDGRVVAVVLVDPVSQPPCMTPQGHVYERVSGKSIRVTDPALLDSLLRRGDAARARAQGFADRIARRALDFSDWEGARAVGLSIAMAPVGRDTDDISGRLFTPSFRDAVAQGVRRFADNSGTPLERNQEQDRFTLIAHKLPGHVLHTGGGASRQERSEWCVQASWDGAVAASASFSPAALIGLSAINHVVSPGWRVVATLVAQLGGYGPAHLSVLVDVRQVDLRKHAPPQEQQPLPPRGSLFVRLPVETWIRRHTAVNEPSPDEMNSVERELARASGMHVDEPGSA